MSSSRTRPYLLLLTAVAFVVALVVAVGQVVGFARPSDPDRAGAAASASATAAPPASPSPSPSVPPAPEPPDGLPVITYAKGPRGLPADPDPESLVPLTEALRPETDMALYDAPGGRARAWLPPRISGLPVVAPIVARENGWAAVLVPAANRRIGWVPEAGWRAEPLRDQLVVNLAARRLTWLRDGAEQGRWSVAIGTDRTPTPAGRTFVLGRTRTAGAVYAGLDALVLGAVPDEPEKLPASLRGAHTGIHAWTNSSAFGRDVSNGCVRMPAGVQRKLLAQIDPGTTVVVTA